MAYPVATMPDGRIKMSDGTIQSAPNSFNSGSPVSTITPNQSPAPQLPQAVKNFVGLSDPITNAPQGLAPASSYEAPPAPAVWAPAQPQQAPQQGAPEVVYQITSDILAGMKPTEIAKYYPEMEWADTEIFGQLFSDVQAGMPVEEASKYYPEIFPQDNSRNDFVTNKDKREGILQNVWGFMNDAAGAALAEAPAAIGDSLTFLQKAWQYNPANLLGTAVGALFSDKTYGELRDDQKKDAEMLADLGNKASEIFKKNAQYDKESAGSAVGTFGTDVAASLVWPNKLGILEKWGKIITKWAGFIKNALNLAGDWALQWAKYGVVTSDGKDVLEALPEIGLEAWYWAAGNLILGGIVKTYGGIKNAPENYKNLKQYLSGLEPREITAIEKASPEKIDEVLRNAKESVANQGDYLQTPYHKWAEEAQKTLDMIDDNFKKTQGERMAILEDVPVEKISLESPRAKLKSSLKALNIEDIRIEDGNPIITPVNGREALVDFNNSADVKALGKLQEILADDVSPVQTMDRIKKLQEWAYENKSTIGIKGTSAKMESLIKKVQGSMNESFKAQLPDEYKKIMTSLAEDIKMKDDIQRLFGIDDSGNTVGNRGELLMKRLTSGTTTGGEARNLAVKIMDKYGVDLIQEARLRQIAMELVDDPRAKTLFGAIQKWKSWVIDLALQKTVWALVNKEWVIRGMAKGKNVSPKVQEPLYPTNLRDKLKASKKAQETEKVRVQNEKKADREAKMTAQERLLASRVPGWKKTTIETPMNPKGNESKVLAGKKGVMVEEKKVGILPEKTLTSQIEAQRKVDELKRVIATNTKSARYGGTGNERVERAVEWAVWDKKITKDEGTKILEDILESVKKGESKYSYMDQKKLESYIEEFKWKKKVESFEDILAEKPPVKKEAPQVQTDKDIYDKLQKMANDGRFGEKSWDDLAKQFKEKTGKDIMDTGFDSFDEAGMIKKTPNTAKEKLVASRKTKAKPTEESKNAKPKEEKYRVAEDMNKAQLTTKILKGLGDRETVSKEFIQNMTNSGDVKQVEKDLIRWLLESEGDKVNVADFKKKVQAELLPLKRVNNQEFVELWREMRRLNEKKLGNLSYTERENINAKSREIVNKLNKDTSRRNKYEQVSLPDDLKWNVKDYIENIYESPIKTSAGGTHFSGQTENYFGHTRLEDMADGSTRRVIEVQSDLFQKGNLEKEWISKRAITDMWDKELAVIDRFGNTQVRAKWETQKMIDARQQELAKLSQYNDPTAHFRMIREEVAQASKDGITKLQFPTGETAMKIEGLGGNNGLWSWRLTGEGGERLITDLTPDNLEVWMTVSNGDPWIITDVLWDGKFKAVPKSEYEFALWAHMDTKMSSSSPYKTVWDMPEDVRLKWIADRISSFNETFDISWKVDQNNPIYKFYEKEVGRYLKNKYDAKLVTDDKGVSWYQVDVKESMGWPVEAFRAGKNITQNLTPKQITEVQELNKKLFGDDKVELTESILSNHEALGSYKDGIIKIVNGQANPKDTYLHEAVHKYLDVFTSEAEHTDILKYASEKYKIDDFVAVEEKLAEDFIKYTKDRAGFAGKMKTYFESVLSRIKSYFGNTDKIDNLYRDISGGKAKEVSVTPKSAKERLLASRKK